MPFTRTTENPMLDQETLTKLRFELEIAINNFHYLYANDKLQVFLNPHYVMGLNYTNKAKAKVEEWVRPAFRECVEFMISPNHKVDGKEWNCGFLGSRWCDKELNGVPTRLCFYSKKYDYDKLWKNAPEELALNGLELDKCDYVIMLDPHQDIYNFKRSN